MSKIFTISEIARTTKYTPTRIYQLLKELNIPVGRHGHTYTITEEAFDKFFKGKVKSAYKW